MSDPLSPEAVAARLQRLRELYVAEDGAAARARLQPTAPRPAAVPSAKEVSARLAELRALLELTRYLHRARFVDRT